MGDPDHAVNVDRCQHLVWIELDSITLRVNLDKLQICKDL